MCSRVEIKGQACVTRETSVACYTGSELGGDVDYRFRFAPPVAKVINACYTRYLRTFDLSYSTRFASPPPVAKVMAACYTRCLMNRVRRSHFRVHPRQSAAKSLLEPGRDESWSGEHFDGEANGVDLVVVGAGREGAGFFDKGVDPGAADEIDFAVLGEVGP